HPGPAVVADLRVLPARAGNPVRRVLRRLLDLDGPAGRGQHQPQRPLVGCRLRRAFHAADGAAHRRRVPGATGQPLVRLTAGAAIPHPDCMWGVIVRQDPPSRWEARTPAPPRQSTRPMEERMATTPVRKASKKTAKKTAKKASKKTAGTTASTTAAKKAASKKSTTSKTAAKKTNAKK